MRSSWIKDVSAWRHARADTLPKCWIQQTLAEIVICVAPQIVMSGGATGIDSDI